MDDEFTYRNIACRCWTSNILWTWSAKSRLVSEIIVLPMRPDGADTSLFPVQPVDNDFLVIYRWIFLATLFFFFIVLRYIYLHVLAVIERCLK